MNKNLVNRGREWEIESYFILKKLFKDVIPVFHKRCKVDLIVFDKKGKEYSVECKRATDNISSSISLQDKDLGADFLLLKLKDKKYFYQRLKLPKIKQGKKK